MRIGIVGAGNIGGALTRRFTELGHSVSVANSRAPGTLQELATETGASAVWARQAARGQDVVVVTIPQCNIPDLPDDLMVDAGPAVVVDTGNYYPRQRDGRIDALEAGAVESRWVERHLGRPVVKAFNNIYADHLRANGQPKGSPDRIALPVAADDEAEKSVVMALVEQLGFDPVDAGRLDDSWRQQPGTPVYTADRDAGGVRQGLLDASPTRKPEWSATSDSPGTFTDPR